MLCVNKWEVYKGILPNPCFSTYFGRQIPYTIWVTHNFTLAYSNSNLSMLHGILIYTISPFNLFTAIWKPVFDDYSLCTNKRIALKQWPKTGKRERDRNIQQGALFPKPELSTLIEHVCSISRTTSSVSHFHTKNGTWLNFIKKGGETGKSTKQARPQEPKIRMIPEE